jgi:hypothetical protein
VAKPQRNKIAKQKNHEMIEKKYEVKEGGNGD